MNHKFKIFHRVCIKNNYSPLEDAINEFLSTGEAKEVLYFDVINMPSWGGLRSNELGNHCCLVAVILYDE